MIDELFLKKIGLNHEQIDTVIRALDSERVFQRILCEEGIPPLIAEKILKATKLQEVNTENLPLMRLKIRETWCDFIRE